MFTSINHRGVLVTGREWSPVFGTGSGQTDRVTDRDREGWSEP